MNLSTIFNSVSLQVFAEEKSKQYVYKNFFFKDTVIDPCMFDGALDIIFSISALTVLKIKGVIEKLKRPVEKNNGRLEKGNNKDSIRPLSFNTPEPLFPLAGQRMIYHSISGYKKSHIFLLNYDVCCCSVPLANILEALKRCGVDSCDICML